jgi:hypothetical protein
MQKNQHGAWDTSGIPVCFYQKQGFERYAVKTFCLELSPSGHSHCVQLKDRLMLKKDKISWRRLALMLKTLRFRK